MRRPPDHPAPTVSFTEEVAGRDTLAAIALDKPTGGANPRSTKHYGDRISNAPGAVSPRVARALDSHPEIVVSFEAAGRETYATLAREIEDEAPTIEISDASPRATGVADLPIESMFNFIVKAPLELLESPIVQADLVRERLLSALPITDARQVTRIEVRPWHDAGSALVRVWCRVP